MEKPAQSESHGLSSTKPVLLRSSADAASGARGAKLGLVLSE